MIDLAGSKIAFGFAGVGALLGVWFSNAFAQDTSAVEHAVAQMPDFGVALDLWKLFGIPGLAAFMGFKFKGWKPPKISFDITVHLPHGTRVEVLQVEEDESPSRARLRLAKDRDGGDGGSPQ